MTLISFMDENKAVILKALAQHVYLVFFSVLLGIIISIPAGIFLSRHKRIASVVLAAVGIVQTIPGLVMLGIALIVLGTGTKTAMAVLAIYSVLPILRNTYTGITEIDSGIKEAGQGIGMTKGQMLFSVELPLATPSIVGGIRISTVYIVSWATLAGLIGAGGLGDLIWTGLATYNTKYILAGALPSAVLAFVFSGIIGLFERLLTPRGLKGGKA
ncbi:MAG: ABC transporter permease [Clostridiales bacterium]|nr:ABC transporter permease [Clostridiales bacterium]